MFGLMISNLQVMHHKIQCGGSYSLLGVTQCLEDCRNMVDTDDRVTIQEFTRVHDLCDMIEAVMR